MYEFLATTPALMAPHPTEASQLITELPAYVHSVATSHKPLPKGTIPEVFWDQEPCDLARATGGVGKFQSLCVMPNTPLSNTSFDRFRILGFAIWDNEKLVRLGLIPLPDQLQPPIVSEKYLVGPCQKDSGRPGKWDIFFRWGSFAAEYERLWP